MEEHYDIWKKKKSPEAMGRLLEAADPVISSALTSYGGGNQSLRGHARLLASQAFTTYDPAKGTKLRTHLMTQLQPLSRMAKEQSQAVHVPERVQADLYRLNQAHQTFRDQHSREPSDKEMADLTSLAPRRIAHIRKLSRTDMPESGMTRINDEGDEEIFYPGTEQADPQRIWVEYVHHDLPPIDQQILEWKTGLYGKPMLSNNDIAKKLGITPGAVSQRSARISNRIAEGQDLSSGA